MPFSQAVLYVSRRQGCAALALSCAELLRSCGVRVTAPIEYCAESVRTALDAQPENDALDGADVAVLSCVPRTRQLRAAYRFSG